MLSLELHFVVVWFVKLLCPSLQIYLLSLLVIEKWFIDLQNTTYQTHNMMQKNTYLFWKLAKWMRVNYQKNISLINYWSKKLLEDLLLAVKVVVSLLSNCSVLLGVCSLCASRSLFLLWWNVLIYLGYWLRILC